MASITEKELLKTDPKLPDRPYQIEALLIILTFVKCLVKMFCGTGKSRIITNVIIHKKQNLNVVVFPSLALIRQYSTDYLNHTDFIRHFKKHKIINVSSEHLVTIESTTDQYLIKKFLKNKSPKIVLVTYQSLHVLLECLEEKKIGLICYDEAHHVVSDECKKLVFGTDYYENEVYFTATPRNENGITMFDRDEPEKNMCGKIAYDYTYLNGLRDGFLNAFDICVDMYTENTNKSIYEAIARAILARNTSRVLSFHSGVNGESNTNVWNFVNEHEFRIVFDRIQRTEFPEKKRYYKKITFRGMDGETKSDERTKMLKALDDTPDNEVYIISSCETIGEGVDTKKANMCVFADPKASITKIIQNIGRVLRRNNAQPLSTVLIPCFVDMNNYAEAGGDPIKQDEIIREQMRATNGDYAPILNVLAALTQEDPDIYDMCLKYPNRKAKEESLKEQGFTIDDDDDDDGDSDYTPEDVEKMKTVDKIPLELHTDGAIERFNEDVKDQPLMRLYHDDETDTYKPIVKECDDSDCDEDEEDDRRPIEPPNPKKRGVGLQVHTNDEIEMLWRVKGELDFNRKFSCVVIECEVSAGEEKWHMTHQKVCDYMDVEKKRPSSIDKNPIIKKIGYWVNDQNKNYIRNNGCMSNPSIRVIWEATKDKYNEYLSSAQEKWGSMLQKSCDYMECEHKMPSQKSKNPIIKKLGAWICGQKIKYKNQSGLMSNITIRAKWETIVEKYKEYLCIDNEEQWELKLQKLCNYMDKEHKSPPSCDKNTEIKKLGKWVGQQKNNYDLKTCIMTNPLIRAKWKATTDKYNDYLCIDDEAQWYLMVHKLCDYMDTENKSPSSHDKNPIIKKLGSWVGTQKKTYAKKDRIMSNQTIRSKWEEITDKYKSYLGDRKELWSIMLQNICSYMDKEKKLPSSSDKNTEIKKLGSWVNNQIYNYTKNICTISDPDIRATWEAMLLKYNEYFNDRTFIWNIMLQNVCDYMDKEHKSPPSCDKNAEIKKLGTWVQHQKTNYKKKRESMSDPEIRSKWEVVCEKYKEYLCIDREELWVLMLQKLCVYMDKEKKRPSARNKNAEIKKLGGWIGTQNKNYVVNIGCMSDPDIRIKWEEMLEKYKHIFIQEPVSLEPVSLAQEPPPPKKKKRNLVIKPTTESASTHTHHPISVIGQFHKTHIRMRSDTLHQKFKDNPTLWEDYHQMRASTFANYDPASIPSNRIIQELEKIKTKRQVVVVDMGCGKASIAHHFQKDTRFVFHNYDHQSGGDTMIQEIDISSLPLDDASAEYAIMSLALWGTKENCIQYIKEAFRVLESKGRLYISDSTKKWSPDPLTSENAGQLLRTMITENGFKIISEDVGIPFCLFVCDKLY